ncbi:MAG: aldo/keto reductase [Bermanella sp.]
MKNLDTKSLISKIELGTVQFGLDYGINNGIKVSEIEAGRIINIFDFMDLTLDTSPAYGSSQYILSKLITSKNRVISKTLSLKNNRVMDVLKEIDRTCELFGSNLYGIMIHDTNDIRHADFDEVLFKLESIRNKGVKIGVSVYSPNQYYQYKENMNIDLVQIPLNILDQRFDCEEFIGSTKDIEVHVRSIFLQGLLLMVERKIPQELRKVIPYINDIKEMAYKNNFNIYELCLSYAFNKTWVDKVLIGLDSEHQASELIKGLEGMSENIIDIDVRHLSIEDENIINPANWNYEN